MKLSRYGLVVAVLVAGSAALPAVAAAPGATEDYRIRIQYDDLDITEPSGAKQLYDRLQEASARACGTASYRQLGSLQRYRDAQVCYDDLLDRLVAKVDSDELQRLHASS